MKTDARYMKLNGTQAVKKYDYEIAVIPVRFLSSGYDEKTSGWSVSNSSNVTVSEADAKQTALDRVSGATQKDIYEWQFDYDDGRPEIRRKDHLWRNGI